MEVGVGRQTTEVWEEQGRLWQLAKFILFIPTDHQWFCFHCNMFKGFCPGPVGTLNTCAEWHIRNPGWEMGKINEFMEGLHPITTCLWAKPSHKSSCKQKTQEHYFVLLTYIMVFKSHNISKDCKELIVIVIINRMHFSTTVHSFATGRSDQVQRKTALLKSQEMEETTLIQFLLF